MLNTEEILIKIMQLLDFDICLILVNTIILNDIIFDNTI